MPTENERLLKQRVENVPQGPFNVTPAFIKKGEGAVLTDVDGREFIDFGGDIGANNVGHCHPK